MHWFLKLLLGLVVIIFLYLFIFYSIPRLLPTEYIKNSSISGIIFQNQIWEGTIRIKGDLWYLKGASVTVRPGTQIIVSKSGDNFNLDILPWHNKNGINIGPEYNGVHTGEPFWDESQKIQIHFASLNILGIKEQPVVLKSDSDLGSPYDFNSITADSGVISYLKASNYRRFELGDDFIVRDSYFTNVGECAICLNQGRQTIINNTFSQSLREYIWINGASPRITDNFFMKSTGAGIRINPNRIGTAIVSYNNFEMPQSKAVDILSGEELEGGVISYNVFAGGSKIKLTCDTKIKFIQNSILGNIQFTEPGCAKIYTFGPNYWGTDKKDTVLAEKFIGQNKIFTIDIPMILKSPPIQVGRRI